MSARSCHGSPNEAGWNPFPLWTNSSLGSVNNSIALWSLVRLSIHFSPSMERLATYAWIISLIGICLPLTVVTSLHKFCKNYKATTLSNPCNQVKYSIQPTLSKIIHAFSVTRTKTDSFQMDLPPLLLFWKRLLARNYMQRCFNPKFF